MGIKGWFQRLMRWYLKTILLYTMSMRHACIIDGVRLHMGKRFTYKHNDLVSIEKNLQRATKMAKSTGGGILLISEGCVWYARRTRKTKGNSSAQEKI